MLKRRKMMLSVRQYKDDLASFLYILLMNLIKLGYLIGGSYD